MGASQSKKKRKEKRKRKRFCSNNEIPRSASIDVIRSMSVSPSLTSCPHCQQSLSWSDSVGVDWRLSSHHHRCLHGQYEEIRVGGAGFESCPNCYSTTSQPHIGQLSTTAFSHDLSTSASVCQHNRHSTMSLNRNFTQQTSRTTGRVQSAELEFSQLLEIMERQKDKTSSALQVSRNRNTSPHHVSMSAHQHSASSSQTPSATINTSSLSSLPPVTMSQQSPSSLASPIADNQVEVLDKKVCVLDDEESKVSRWVKRKQMAQQLRDLRRHLENGESCDLPAPLLSTGQEISPCEDENQLKSRWSNNQPKCETANVQSSTSPTTNLSSDIIHSSAASPTRRPTRSKFSRMSNYRYLDNHPVLTRLQNEQNNRLESMERRMKEIRISAMQEAERRKFAEIFPAKNDDSETQKMLEEAKQTLEKLKEEKRQKMLSLQGQQQQQQPTQGHQEQSTQTSSDVAFKDSKSDSSISHDAGEIIPVCVVPHRESKSTLSKLHRVLESGDKSKEVERKDKPFWLKKDWPEINLNQPLTWLMLPFLLFPLILRMLMSLIINTSTTALNDRTSAGSSSSNNGVVGVLGAEDRSNRRPSDSLPGLSRLGSKKLS